MLKKLFYLIVCAVVFVNCGDEPTPEEIALELSESELVFEAAGGVKTFIVTCNGEWKIEGTGEWCTVDADAGNGNRTVSVTAAAYEEMEDRNVNLTVKAGDKAKVVGVTQKRKDAVVLSKDKLEVAQDGGTLSVEVKSNIDYEVTVPEEFREWISLLPESKAVESRTYRFAIGENNTPESRQGYIVFAGETVKDTAYVVQEAGGGQWFMEKVSGVSFDMVYVKGGTFKQGEGVSGGGFEVTVGDYYLAKYEVTQELWKAVMGTTIEQQRDKAGQPEEELYGVGDKYPMYYVSWGEVQDFVKKLSELTGRSYRLPTEAEWEYAAIGGENRYGYVYSGSDNIDEVAWYGGNSSMKSHPVGGKKANELGIYDMSGNVYEWCEDWAELPDPNDPEDMGERVLRGGGWSCNTTRSQVLNRFGVNPGSRYANYGFRVVCSL